jgi:CRP-like cAMP-binding protein/tetratricopeptide (TPR) repeat protein
VGEDFGSGQHSFGETRPGTGGRSPADAEHAAARGDGRGAETETNGASEVPVVAANVRWERPTARSFWDSLSEPERRALASSAVENVFRPGWVLCGEGDESSQVMVIHSGWTKVSVKAGPGEQIIAVRGPGDVVGERAALLARVRSASVTALDEVRAMVVPAERFTEFLVSNPRAAEVLDRQIRERGQEDRARDLAGEPGGAQRRLAWLLFDLARHRGGYRDGVPAVFRLPMSQQELADWAGVSLDSVAKSLRAWRDQGIVRMGRRQVSVVDPGGLAAICGAAPATPDAGGGAGPGEGGRRHQPGPVNERRQGDHRRPDLTPAAAAGDWGLTSSLNCSVLATDVAGFGAAARNDEDRRAVRQALYDILRTSFGEANVPWAECYYEDRGDGVLIVVPPLISTALLVDPLIAVLGGKLRRYNRHASEVVRIQLRAALHVGPVSRDAEGLMGQALITTARMLDAQVLKDKLREAGADLAFAASAYVFDHFVRQGGQVDPADFERIDTKVKESDVTAWVYLSGTLALPPHGGRPAPDPAIAPRAAPDLVPDAGPLPVAAPFGLLPAEVRGRDGLLAELGRPFGHLPRHAERAWVIAGMGGVGKSTVALAAARAAKARGWRVWWVTAADTASLTGGMLEVLRELGAPESVTVPVREGAPTAPGRAWDFLNGHHHAAAGKWMLIFDGADNPAVLAAPPAPGVAAPQAPADGTGWLRADPAGMVIVTTRNRDARVWGAGVVLRELRSLDEAAAAEVLRDLAPRVADPTGEQARQLAGRLGGLPLALHLAGAYLASPFARWASFDGYRMALDSVELPAALRDIESPGADPRATIQRTWDLSLDALAADGRPQARPLLLVLSCCAAATPIPASLLRPQPLATMLAAAPATAAPADDPRPDAAEHSAAAGPGGDARRLREGLQGLSSTGLIDVAESGEPAGVTAVTVHRVVADVNRSRLLTMGRAGRMAVCGAVVAMFEASAAGLDSARPADWPAWRMLVPHVSAALELLAPELEPGVLARLLRVAADGTDALLRGGRLAAAEKLARASVTAAAAAGPDDPASLTARGSLAQALARLGRIGEAEHLYRGLLEDKSRVLGAEHPDTLATRHDLARAIGSQGRYAVADELYRGLLADQSRVLGDRHPDTLATRHNLARIIGRRGRYTEAERLCRGVLADRRQVLGDGHPDTMATRHSLARMIGLQGRYGEAEQLYRQVLAQRQQVLGGAHPDTLATRHRLARMVGLQGRYREAEELCRQVLADRQRLHGEDHPDNLATRHRLARMVGLQGRYGEAERMFRHVLEQRRRLLGAQHPDTLATGHRLAWLIGRQGRYGEAEELAGRVLGDRRQVLGDDHPDTLGARATLAWLAGLQGRYPEAERLCRGVLADRRRVLGDEHPETLATGHDLARLVAWQGRYAEAEQLCREVLTGRQRVLGGEHPDTLASRAMLAWLTAHSGRYGEAERRCAGVLAGRRRLLGDEHPDTLATRHDLARMIGLQGRYAEAERLCRGVLTSRQQVLGDEHPDTLATRAALAWLAAQQGRRGEAELQYRQVLAARRRVLGASHPDTVATNRELAQVIADQGNAARRHRPGG